MSVPRAISSLRRQMKLMAEENDRLRQQLEAALDTLDRHIQREKAKDAKEGDEK
jgi:regulator of replication initiation timing